MTPPRTSVSHRRQDRRVRIELLRMRAGYERLQLRQETCVLTRALRPGALLTQARDHLEAAGLGWLGRGLRLSRRFPVLLSLASTVWSVGARRRVLLKAALVAGLIWLARHPPRDGSSAE